MEAGERERARERCNNQIKLLDPENGVWTAVSKPRQDRLVCQGRCSKPAMHWTTQGGM